MLFRSLRQKRTISSYIYVCVCACIYGHISAYISNRVCSTRKRGNGFNLREEKVRLDKWKNFCSGDDKLLAQIAREIVNAPFPETFKVGLDGDSRQCDQVEDLLFIEVD